jgi:hypothetical protein
LRKILQNKVSFLMQQRDSTVQEEERDQTTAARDKEKKEGHRKGHGTWKFY